MKPRVLRCAIEDINTWHPFLFAEPYAVAFVAVTGQYSIPPAHFLVRCEGVRSRRLGQARLLALEVSWTEETVDKAERMRATLSSRTLVEFAAVGVALILVHEVIPLGTLNVMEQGSGADYRSTVVRRVLEASGTESPRELGRRHREKVVQALANPFGWGTLVIVTAFCEVGHRVQVSEHPGKEFPHAGA
jgi:hypothetical protein